jgi:hypothetical protein
MNIPTPLPSSTVNQELVERFHQRVVNREYDFDLHAIFNSSLRNRIDQEALLSRLPAEVISNLSPAFLTSFSETFLETLPEPVKDRINTYRRDMRLAAETRQKEQEQAERETASELVTTVTEWLQNGGKKISGTAIAYDGQEGFLDDELDDHLPHASYKERIKEMLDVIAEEEEVEQHVTVGAALKLAKTEDDFELVFDDIRRAVDRIDSAGRYDRDWRFWRDTECELHLADVSWSGPGSQLYDDAEAVTSPDGTEFIITVLDGEDLLEQWKELIKETPEGNV